jgi:hypothetical protein
MKRRFDEEPDLDQPRREVRPQPALGWGFLCALAWVPVVIYGALAGWFS